MALGVARSPFQQKRLGLGDQRLGLGLGLNWDWHWDTAGGTSEIDTPVLRSWACSPREATRSNKESDSAVAAAVTVATQDDNRQQQLDNGEMPHRWIRADALSVQARPRPIASSKEDRKDGSWTWGRENPALAAKDKT